MSSDIPCITSICEWRIAENVPSMDEYTVLHSSLKSFDEWLLRSDLENRRWELLARPDIFVLRSVGVSTQILSF